jgi:FADH2 O2-dependent halogenase
VKWLTADVLIAGSGFGGSLLAWILAKHHMGVVMFDPRVHPRFAIGESSTPIADMILADLAKRYRLTELAPLAQYGTWCLAYPQLRRGRKRGFSYFGHNPDSLFHRPQPGCNELLVAASSDDFACDTHWYRADVDAFLVQQAIAAGAICLAPVHTARAEYRTGRWHLELHGESEAWGVAAPFLVDASGGPFGQRWLDAGSATETLNTWSEAIYTHLQNVPTWQSYLETAGYDCHHHPYDCDAAALHHVFPGGWMWQLRFDCGTVSVGVVLSRPWADCDSPQQQIERFLQRYPSLQQQLRTTRLAAVPGCWIRSGRLQRRAARAVGCGWVALPHAYGFIDPLHSTGIAHTLSGVERLARILISQRDVPPEAEALQHYAAQLQQEIQLIDRLVDVAYRNSGQFSRFVLAAMLYFTATVWYETRRRQGHRDDAFLCANDLHLQGALQEACRLLQESQAPCDCFPYHSKQTVPIPDPQEDSGDESRLEQTIRAIVAPFNVAGLFNPATRNMYRHTATR